MHPSFSVGRTIRKTQRTREILTILVRYGFRSIIQELDLDRLALRGRKLVGVAEPEEAVKREPTEVRLRKALEELGPTFVKLGQVLSLRPDLVPPKWAEEFRHLQDNVPPVAFEMIEKRLEVAYGDERSKQFKSIEEKPLAAASIAQVHRAKLKSGENVVLKILRPGIEEVMQSDMDILYSLAEFAETHFSNLGYSPTEVVEQFSTQLDRELDLTHEARSVERMRRSFTEDEGVSFPKVFRDLSTRKILVMEEVKGVLLSKRQPDDLTKRELREVVANGTDAVFRQCLEIGFFHADPHPGNIFALPGGRICFIDCGMVGHIDPGTAGLLADLVHGVINGDLNRVIDVILTLGTADPALADDRGFRADTWEYISRFEHASFDELDMGILLRDFFERLRRHGLRAPADIVLLIKAISTIEGVGEDLDPSFDVVGHVQPYVERLVKSRYGIGALRQRLQDSMLGYAQLAEDGPRNIRWLLDSVRRRRFAVKLEHAGVDELSDTIERASATIGHYVFVGSLILGSSILVLADSTREQPGALTIVAAVGFVAALTLLLGRIVLGYLR
jgi:ubiquinone biosynthesis protein